MQSVFAWTLTSTSTSTAASAAVFFVKYIQINIRISGAGHTFPARAANFFLFLSSVVSFIKIKYGVLGLNIFNQRLSINRRK